MERERKGEVSNNKGTCHSSMKVSTHVCIYTILLCIEFLKVFFITCQGGKGGGGGFAPLDRAPG